MLCVLRAVINWLCHFPSGMLFTVVLRVQLNIDTIRGVQWPVLEHKRFSRTIGLLSGISILIHVSMGNGTHTSWISPSASSRDRACKGVRSERHYRAPDSSRWRSDGRHSRSRGNSSRTGKVEGVGQNDCVVRSRSLGRIAAAQWLRFDDIADARVECHQLVGRRSLRSRQQSTL